MNILAIETSCDETAVSILEARGDTEAATFTILGNSLFSQSTLHAEFGGVYPNLAKREHGRNLIPLLEQTLKQAELYSCANIAPNTPPKNVAVEKILEREPELLKQFLRLFAVLEKPAIDAIAVTYGPGLEPALWVGINFAKALSRVWDIPIIPIDHMEGHIFASVLKSEPGTKNQELQFSTIQFPALALLISGGHTQLVSMNAWFEYDVIGETRDDAVGEAFDKVARMLKLPYPGGPEVSRFAETARVKNITPSVSLPRPMLTSNNYDLSFSGLKTAVLYALRNTEITDHIREEFSLEFENAVADILIKKTKKAIEEFGIKTIIIGGGVSANKHIRTSFKNLIKNEYQNVKLYLPAPSLSTDNAIMIGVAGYFRHTTNNIPDTGNIKATGNLKLTATRSGR